MFCEIETNRLRSSPCLVKCRKVASGWQNNKLLSPRQTMVEHQSDLRDFLWKSLPNLRIFFRLACEHVGCYPELGALASTAWHSANFKLYVSSEESTNQWNAIWKSTQLLYFHSMLTRLPSEPTPILPILQFKAIVLSHLWTTPCFVWGSCRGCWQQWNKCEA